MRYIIIYAWFIITTLFGALGGLFAHGIAGLLTALPCLWLWALGTVNNTKEYHSGRVPDWIIWELFDEPKENPKYAWLYSSKFYKSLASVLLIVFAISGLVPANVEISYLILLLLTWVCGVVGIEYHFRSHYTMR